MIAGIVKDMSFAMLTTEPGPDVAPIHDRQIVMLPEKATLAAWGEDAALPGPQPQGALNVVQA